MKEKLQKIREEAVRQIEEAKELNALNDVRVSVLGKKGELTAVLKGMKDVKPEDRPMVGQLVNETREAIERTLEETKKKLESAELEHRLEKEVIDVTLPAKQNSVGHRHPNMIALEEVERIFVGMGYEVVAVPEVEQDYYNFEALNIPKNHPARDEQDTFYINDEYRAPYPDLSGTGACHGGRKTSDPYDRTGQSVPFRRSGCDTFPVFPSD